MKTREVLKLLRENGFEIIESRGKGSHYLAKKGNVRFPIPKAKTDIPPGTLNSILKLAGLK